MARLGGPLAFWEYSRVRPTARLAWAHAQRNCTHAVGMARRIDLSPSSMRRAATSLVNVNPAAYRHPSQPRKRPVAFPCGPPRPPAEDSNATGRCASYPDADTP